MLVLQEKDTTELSIYKHLQLAKNHRVEWGKMGHQKPNGSPTEAYIGDYEN